MKRAIAFGLQFTDACPVQVLVRQRPACRATIYNGQFVVSPEPVPCSKPVRCLDNGINNVGPIGPTPGSFMKC